jgi:hypothetical protein
VKHALTLAAALAVACLPAARPGRAQGAPDLVYGLSSPPSEFEWGCFGPCACPILIQSPLQGSFILRFSHSDPLFTYFNVLDVHWKVPGPSGPVTISGSGSYRRGGEVALEEQLTLDLSFGGAPPQRFDSGPRPPGAPFPEIDTRVSLHQEYCHDSVLAVVAKPIDPTGVGEAPGGPPIVATPDPFAEATAIGFVMPAEGLARLLVFDMSGRRARMLMDSTRLPAGPIARSWDGRLDNGRRAPPGLYMVRLETPAGRFTRMLVKLR